MNYQKEKLRKKIPFTIATYKNKIPRNKFNQGGKRLVLGKLVEESEEDTNKWKHMPCSWTGRINIIKCPYYPKLSIDSMQFLLKYQWHISWIWNKYSKYVYGTKKDLKYP